MLCPTVMFPKQRKKQQPKKSKSFNNNVVFGLRSKSMLMYITQRLTYHYRNKNNQ